MSRRDTIIVAALINAGLLIILFVSALKNPGQNENNVVPSKSNYSVSRDNHPKKEAKAFSGDEVEQILNQFNKQPQQPIVVLPDSLAVEVNEEKGILAQSETTPNFIEDLNTLSKPSSQASEPPSNVIVSESSLQEIHVKKGDVLEKIAKSCNISVQDLIKLNKLSSTNLHIGQVLKVPVGSLNAKTTPSQPQPTSTPQNASTDPIAKYYVVKPGDNPWTIAVKNHMKVEELLKLNNMDEAKARKLKPGDQIRIR